jgi:hypothetical protein
MTFKGVTVRKALAGFLPQPANLPQILATLMLATILAAASTVMAQANPLRELRAGFERGAGGFDSGGVPAGAGGDFAGGAGAGEEVEVGQEVSISVILDVGT